MVEQLITKRVMAVQRALHHFFETVLHSPAYGGRTLIANFLTGDPQELPPLGFVEAVQHYSVPTSRDWGLPTASCTNPHVRQRQRR